LTNPKINHKLPETLRPTQTEIGRRSSTQYLLGIIATLMRLTFVLAVSLFCMSARADIPAYLPMRDFVEKHCATNTVPKDERIFVGHAYSADYTSIIRFHKSISLHEIVDQTPFKDKTVYVLVMRPGGMSEDIAVKPSETPKFDLKPLDVIWIYDQIPVF
jgi:hypothetical protein